MNKRTIRIIICVAVITVLLMSTVFAVGVKKNIEVLFNSVNLTVNGNKVNAETIVYNGITYVPLRATAEMLDKDVGWNQATNTASVNDKVNKEIITIPSITPAPIPNEIKYSEINKPYVAKDGLTVTVTNLSKIEDVGSIKYTISYTLKNDTQDKKIDEGTFKIHFADDSSINQYGFFGSLFPSQSLNRTYTFEELKIKKGIVIEYGAGFFDNKLQSDTLRWKID